MNAEKKIAVVTGASRGIGRAIALELARQGAFVIINYNGSKEKAEAVKAEIQADGGQYVTEQRLPVSQDLIERIVDVVKPARAVLEDDSIVYRSRDYLRIGDTSGYALYHIRVCGTYPNASKQGRIEYEVVLISSDSDAVKYSAPRTGEIESGTFPNPAMQGGVEDGNILFESSGAASAYHARMCGTALGSL